MRECGGWALCALDASQVKVEVSTDSKHIFVAATVAVAVIVIQKVVEKWK